MTGGSSRAAAFLRRVARGSRRLASMAAWDVRAGEPGKAARLAVALARRFVLGSAAALKLETSRVCNLRCPACPAEPWRTEGRGRPFMPPEDVRALLDQVRRDVHEVFLYYRGEPLLDPALADHVAHATRRRMHTILSSNLTVLDRPTARRLVAARLDRLIVAVDGASPESYARMRPGGRLDAVLANVRMVLEERVRRKAVKPRVEVQLIVSRENEAELDRFMGLVRELGADLYSIKTLGVKAPAPGAGTKNGLGERLLPRRGPVRRTGRRCAHLSRGVVTTEGDLALCCYDADVTVSTGNVFRTPFPRLWRSPEGRAVRERMKRRGYPICERCPASSDVHYVMSRRPGRRSGRGTRPVRSPGPIAP